MSSQEKKQKNITIVEVSNQVRAASRSLATIDSKDS